MHTFQHVNLPRWVERISIVLLGVLDMQGVVSLFLDTETNSLRSRGLLGSLFNECNISSILSENRQCPKGRSSILLYLAGYPRVI